MGRRGRRFDQSEEVKRIIARGKEARIGDLITYTEWSVVAGVADIRKARHLLSSAFNRLIRDLRIVFGCVEGVGYKRLDPAEIASVAANYIPKIHRAAKRASMRGNVAREKYSDLPREKQVELNMTEALLGTLTHCSSAPMRAAAIKHYGNDGAPTLPGDLGAFKKS